LRFDELHNRRRQIIAGKISAAPDLMRDHQESGPTRAGVALG
jgi:hypothetical protein